MRSSASANPSTMATRNPLSGHCYGASETPDQQRGPAIGAADRSSPALEALAEAAFTRPERGSDPPSGIRRRSDLVANRSNLTLLAERAQNTADVGDVERLVRSLDPAVRRTCRGVLGHAHAELQDAVQDCLLEIVRALPNYRFQGDFLHYANTISLRVAALIRRRSAQRMRRFDDLEAFVAEPGPMAATELDRARQVRRVLRRLPRPQAEALSMHFVLGLSVQEAAALTQVSPNTVKTRIRLGKQRLLRTLRGLSLSRERAAGT